MTKESLAKYRRKRDFTKTTEPSGENGTPSEGEPAFVVQIHDASTLHFDFRLEADGVLKSFAIPKGPSDDPEEKRLAMPTEDHPMEYRSFEGTIAEGEYGGGTVIVWDEGTYQNLTTDRRGRSVDLSAGLRKGHVSFRLHGSKLHGGYALTRIRKGNGSSRESWLLVKEADRHAAAHGTPDPRRARSIRTGRTLKQTAADREPERAQR